MNQSKPSISFSHYQSFYTLFHYFLTSFKVSVHKLVCVFKVGKLSKVRNSYAYLTFIYYVDSDDLSHVLDDDYLFHYLDDLDVLEGINHLNLNLNVYFSYNYDCCYSMFNFHSYSVFYDIYLLPSYL